MAAAYAKEDPSDLLHLGAEDKPAVIPAPLRAVRGLAYGTRRPDLGEAVPHPAIAGGCFFGVARSKVLLEGHLVGYGNFDCMCHNFSYCIPGRLG